SALVVLFHRTPLCALCALSLHDALPISRLVFGFVTMDSIALEPHFRAARQSGAIDVMELDEGMLQWGLYAAANRLPFMPTRAGLDRKSTRLNSSHGSISYAVFCLRKKNV